MHNFDTEHDGYVRIKPVAGRPRINAAIPGTKRKTVQIHASGRLGNTPKCIVNQPNTLTESLLLVS